MLARKDTRNATLASVTGFHSLETASVQANCNESLKYRRRAFPGLFTLAICLFLHRIIAVHCIAYIAVHCIAK